MELQYLRQEALDNLKKNIGTNLAHYVNQDDCDWVDDYFQKAGLKRPIFNSEIEIVDIVLQNGSDPSLDAENAITLHKALRGKLNPVQASDRRLWAALTHTVFYSYMCSRWPVTAKPDDTGPNGTVIDRYFLNRGLLRNGIARLYWLPEMTYDEKLDDPYEYTRYLMSAQDLIIQIEGRSLCRNHEILCSTLKSLKENEPLNTTQRRLYYEGLTKRGGITVLDALPSDKMDGLCEKIVSGIKDAKHITNECRITVQAIGTGSMLVYDIHSGQPYIGKTQFRCKPKNLAMLTTGKQIEIGSNMYRIVNIE